MAFARMRRSTQVGPSLQNQGQLAPGQSPQQWDFHLSLSNELNTLHVRFSREGQVSLPTHSGDTVLQLPPRLNREVQRALCGEWGVFDRLR